MGGHAVAVMLDPAIRAWVLLPITFVMFLIGLLRHFVMQLTKAEPKVDLDNIKEGQTVMRAQWLRTNGVFLPEAAYASRKAHFAHKEHGVLRKETQSVNPQAAMMSDPTMMMDMMKKNVHMIVPQMLTGAWVNFFFTGFVIAKIPFPLTQRFRTMLQRGIDLASLDVTYVSSLSWYFLNLFGLRGLNQLVLGRASEEIDDTKLMGMQQQMTGMGMDTSKAFAAELQQMEFMRHNPAVMDGFEPRALKLLTALNKKEGRVRR